MKTVAVVAILSWAMLAGAQPSVAPPQHPAAKQQPAKPTPKKLSPDQEMWCPILDYAVTGSRSFEPPMRSYLLETAAVGLAKCDAAKVPMALVDSFTATLSIPEKEDELSQQAASGDVNPDDQATFESISQLETKQDLQESALSHLLSVDVATAESLVHKAEPSTQAIISTALVSQAVSAKNYDRALELLKRFPSSDFPYGAATELALALPPSRDGDKQEIFLLAMAADHEHHFLVLGRGDFASMIVRFWKHVHPAIALEAIHQVLDAAQSNKDTGITLKATSGNVGFTSEYDYRAFELLPILRQLDESEADKVLRSSQQAQSQLQQFPKGIQSINPVIRDSPPEKGETARIAGSIGPANHVGRALRDANVSDASNSRIAEIVRIADQSPRQAIAAAASLPTSDGLSVSRAENPRAKALLAIAQAMVKKNPSAAKDALVGLAEALKDSPRPYREMRKWVAAMNIAKQIGDIDLALKLFRSGMDQADTLGLQDADADDPNLALKAWWPSVSAAWLLVNTASEISPGATLERVRETKDPEVLLLLEVRLANKGLGAPLDGSITKVQKKSSHETWAEYRSPEE